MQALAKRPFVLYARSLSRSPLSGFFVRAAVTRIEACPRSLCTSRFFSLQVAVEVMVEAPAPGRARVAALSIHKRRAPPARRRRPAAIAKKDLRGRSSAEI